jgi:hypothetical protein
MPFEYLFREAIRPIDSTSKSHYCLASSLANALNSSVSPLRAFLAKVELLLKYCSPHDA